MQVFSEYDNIHKLIRLRYNQNVNLLKRFKKLIEKIDDKFFYAVMGGVAVDGYVGKLTRNHHDVDMIIFREDVDRAETVLDDLGYKPKRFTHPEKPNLEYKMQTGDEDHLFSFQILDRIDNDKFEISFYRDPYLVFPLHYIKTPTWLELEGIKFPVVSKEFLIKLKENELMFFEKLKRNNREKYEEKRKQKHINSLHDLELLRK